MEVSEILTINFIVAVESESNGDRSARDVQQTVWPKSFLVTLQNDGHRAVYFCVAMPFSFLRMSNCRLDQQLFFHLAGNDRLVITVCRHAGGKQSTCISSICRFQM